MAAKKIEIIYDINGKAIDVAIDKTLNLQQQAKALTAELRRTKEGSDEFKLLSTRLGDAQDGLAKTSAKSKDLFTSLSLLPGPVGQFFGQLSQSIELLKTFSSFSLKDISFQIKETANDIGDVGKNLVGLNEVEVANTAATEAQAAATAELATAEQAATVATAEQTVATEAQTAATEAAEVATIGLGTALKALGIGLIIAGVVALIAYWDDLKDAIMGTSDATRAWDASMEKGAAAAADAQTKVTQVGVAFKAAKEGVISKKQALNEYNKTLGGTIGEAKTLEEAEKLYNDNTANYIKATGLRAQAQELFALSAKKNAEAATAQERGFWDFNRGLFQSYEDELAERKKKLTKDANDLSKKGEELLKQGLALETKYKPKEETATKVENQDKEFKAKAQKLQDDLTSINKKGGKDRELQDIQNAAEAEKREIKALKVSPENEKKKNDLILQVQEIANKKKKEVNDKYDEEEKKKAEQHAADLLAAQGKLAEGKVKAIADETERSKAERRKQQDDEVIELKKLLKDKLITQKEYNEAVKNSEQALNNDLKAIDEKKEAEDNEKRIAKLDDELKYLQMKGAILTKGTMEYYDNLSAQIDAVEKRDIEQAKINGKAKKQTEKEIQAALDLIQQEAVDKRKKLKQQELNDYLEFGAQVLGGISNIMSQASQVAQMEMQNELKAAGDNAEKQNEIKKKYFEKNKQSQKAEATIGMLTGAIQAYKSLAGIPVVGPALGIAAAAAVIYYGTQKISAIDAQKYDDGGNAGKPASSTTPASNGAGRNYAVGGVLDGPRHAQGGIPIVAEGGEAVMTRGAVTMFKPLLSLMNQAGGGVAFSQNLITTRPDNPKSSFPSDYQNQPIQIVKTYVVEGELTSMQQKQARLKDLSTI